MRSEEQAMAECLHCGNPVEEVHAICPYCGSHEVETARENLRIRNVDIGHNNWTVNQARNELEKEFAASYKRSDDFLIVVHGHGSTGKGGEIKVMVHQFALRMISMKRIRDFISGEHLTRTSSAARRVSANYPSIKQLSQWNTRNPGLSILIF